MGMANLEFTADFVSSRTEDTYRMSHRDTETQRHRDTETQRHRDTETQRHRDTEKLTGESKPVERYYPSGASAHFVNRGAIGSGGCVPAVC
jgi:hypothetical protein